MEILNGMAIFTTVVESGSFTAAAGRLGLSKSAVSKQVTRLEDQLGARLLNRTTRSLSLTDAGQLFFDRASRIVEEAEDAAQCVSDVQQIPRGRLKISAPLSFGITHLAPCIARFAQKYDEVTIDMDLNDRMIDLVEDRVDLAIRITRLKDSSLIARKITTTDRLVVATPDYWDRHGRPEHPRDLVGHNCFLYAYLSTPRMWEFCEPGGKAFTVKVDGKYLGNNGNVTARMAAEGLGVAALPSFLCEEYLADGRLEVVLQDYLEDPIGVYAVFPHSRHMAAKTRAFLDHLVAYFKT